MFAFASRVLNSDDDNFLGGFINQIIDKIRIAARHQFAQALNRLLPSDMRKLNKILECFKNGSANPQCSLWISRKNVIGNIG